MRKKAERLLDAMTQVSDAAVEEAAEVLEGRRPFPWKRAGTIAATAAGLALIVGIGSWKLLPRMGGNSNAGGAGVDDGDVAAATFMSYAGPVFPLALKEENPVLTARREITLDFAPWVPVWRSNEEEADREGLTEEEKRQVLEDYNQWYPEGGRYQSSTDILVTDAYTLENSGKEAQTVTLLYPFSSSLGEVEEDRPALTADGRELETTLRAGSYAGGYMGAVGADLVTEAGPGSLNLSPPQSWADYQAVLEDGSYIQGAFAEEPDFSGVPAIVYEFENPWGPEPGKDLPNPTIRASFRLDEEKTTVLSYGFHGMSRDKGRMAQCFSIPQAEEPLYGRSFRLIVLGEDISGLETRGYATGGFDTQKTIDAGVDVRRYETTLEEILRETAGEMYGGEDSGFPLYYRLMKEQLLTAGVLSDNLADRYSAGWLEELDFASLDRVFYLEAEITIPAESAVTLRAEMRKEGSFDYYCANAENRGIYGYDLVTRLGANLACAEQTAILEDRGQIDIIRQNFGFNLENGVEAVPLDLNEPHYYLEVRRKEP